MKWQDTHDVKKVRQHSAKRFARNPAVENSRKELSSVTSMLTDDESVPKRLVSEITFDQERSICEDLSEVIS